MTFDTVLANSGVHGLGRTLVRVRIYFAFLALVMGISRVQKDHR